MPNALYSVALFVLFMGIATGQNRSTPNGSSPARGVGYTIITPAVVPHSLEQLIRSSDLVLEGTIERRGDTWRRNVTDVGSLETDFSVRVDRVLKGQAPRRIMVSELGGISGPLAVVPRNNRFLMAGERYVLFLEADRRAGLASQPSVGAPRYVVVGVSSGKFQIVEGRVRPSEFSAPDIITAHDKEPLDSFSRKIEAITGSQPPNKP